jgi:hypothetical protein
MVWRIGDPCWLKAGGNRWLSFHEVAFADFYMLITPYLECSTARSIRARSIKHREVNGKRRGVRGPARGDRSRPAWVRIGTHRQKFKNAYASYIAAIRQPRAVAVSGSSAIRISDI